jgi:hypothetical protein|tara:strand:+ start:1997 stop:2383 length:387 start_codon:yes stop_codon:yes gene_type:complete
MDTGAFVTIWRNHIAKPGSDNWKKFVLSCFKRFAVEEYNRNSLKAAGWGAGTIDLSHLPANKRDAPLEKQYEFLSERCYSKCMTIKGKLKREKDFNVELPDGYLTRTGSGARRRFSLDDIKSVFEMKD